MKKYFASAVLSLCLVLPGIAVSADEKAAPESFEEKLSYSMGYEVGNYFKSAGGDIQKELLLRGIVDAYDAEKPALAPDEMAAVQKEYAVKMQEAQKAKIAVMLEKNKAAGDAYLAENMKKDGVVVTESGLQYEILKQGEGDKPQPTDKVKVDYVGTLVDGKEFDSSIKRGQPAVFGVGQVIKGWGEAMKLMNVGTKLRIVIPSDLGYGAQGVAPLIEPNSVLIFEVELLEIVKEVAIQE